MPEYTTDLDLNDDEKKAVDGALVAFEGFWTSVNEAYSGDFGAIDEFPKYASGEALESIESEAESIKTDAATFEGEIVPSSVSVYDVVVDDGNPDASSVVVQFCVDTSKWTYTESGNSPTTNPDGKVTMEHKIGREGEAWKVNEQALWERTC